MKIKSISFKWNGINYAIGDKHPVFIIAEAGVNHNGKLELAKKLVTAAKKSGADAVKFQTFITEEIAIPKVEKAEYHKRTTPDSLSWFDLLKSEELPKRYHEELIKLCKKLNIVFFSTPYDFQSVDLLDSLDVPLIKIASTDLTNLPLITHAAKKGRPLIISTGMSTLNEVKEAYKACLKVGNKNIIFLQCTANYPTKVENANLNVMTTLKHELKTPIGYSDHTLDFVAGISAVARGACVIEKHFTISKKLPGPDHPMSLEPNELTQYIEYLRMAEKSLGNHKKFITKEEAENRKKLQKSIVSNTNIKAGQILSKKDIGIKRPATGIQPKYYTKLIGKKAKRDIPINTPIRFNDMVF